MTIFEIDKETSTLALQTLESYDGGAELTDLYIYEEAVLFANLLAASETRKSDDNHGGALLHRSIPFGD